MKESHNEHGWLELLRKWLSGDATHTDESEMETHLLHHLSLLLCD